MQSAITLKYNLYRRCRFQWTSSSLSSQDKPEWSKLHGLAMDQLLMNEEAILRN